MPGSRKIAGDSRMETGTVQYKLLNPDDLFQLTAYLEKIDAEFTPPLSSRQKLECYAQKMLDKGYVYAAFSGIKMGGLCAFYANDIKTRQAFLTLLQVDRNWRRQGVAAALCKRMFRLCEDKGMQMISLFTHMDNKTAQLFYKSQGFLVTGQEEERLCMTRTLSD